MDHWNQIADSHVVSQQLGATSFDNFLPTIHRSLVPKRFQNISNDSHDVSQQLGASSLVRSVLKTLSNFTTTLVDFQNHETLQASPAVTFTSTSAKFGVVVLCTLMYAPQKFQPLTSTHACFNRALSDATETSFSRIFKFIW